MVVCEIAYTLSLIWPAPGIFLLVKLPVIILIIVVGFRLLWELDAREIDFFRNIFAWQAGDR